jgi:hypothetical protein
MRQTAAEDFVELAEISAVRSMAAPGQTGLTMEEAIKWTKNPANGVCRSRGQQ